MVVVVVEFANFRIDDEADDRAIGFGDSARRLDYFTRLGG